MNRFSSRRQPLDASFLAPRLAGARSYDRIAGYFSSSILEVAGEALESAQGPIRLICNSGLDAQDVVTAKAAQAALRQEWCGSHPENLGEGAKHRFARLYRFLASRRLEVRVLPDERFGLIHGKAGVITLANGGKTAFMGSANETFSAWKLNYELVWEDDSPDAVAWVQEEFDALWGSLFAVPLAEFVVEDVGRLARREVVHSIEKWREAPEPAAAVIESPVYREHVGLWAHQKHFVKLAFDAHRGPFGARFVLADQVGLGKTLQLAITAELIALTGDKPILVLAPKPLVWQWQDELANLLDLPAAVWDGRQWVDEAGIEHPSAGPESIRKCPRRIGIVSTGLVTRRSEVTDYPAHMDFDCVIVDEAHRARRKNLASGQEYDAAQPNNLLAFVREISPHTRSLLLATATPVQLHPIEAWDLLDALACGSDAVLGAYGAPWRRPRQALELVMGEVPPPVEELVQWEWLRNPFPPATEGVDYRILRQSLRLSDTDAVAPGGAFQNLPAPDRARIGRIFPRFLEGSNPIIRHIVLRTRSYLESEVDPESGEPYLKPVKVNLHGEGDDEAIKLPPFLQDAYVHANEFCRLLGTRTKSGFFRTLLLRRVGSSMEAGRLTAERILQNWVDIEEDDDEEENDLVGQMKTLTPDERAELQRFMRSLEANRERDPKYHIVRDLLVDRRWLESGCIVFSQYFDSIWWLANQLTRELPDEDIGVYAGASRSGIMRKGVFARETREELKAQVRKGRLRLILGTDAASEGLNLQRLGTLVNFDLPWNPSRLEQRKGRIQRIGQIRDSVEIYNMRYAGSVEDRVHALLSQRLKDISALFGQIPDVLEDVWVNVALGDMARAQKTIDAVPRQHPFKLRYHRVEKVEWESCAQVLNSVERKAFLSTGWT
ncbi:MAG: helicase SNF2 [Betaproteobacteria bacterium]|nr:helicase SNF2 [Betaproteobacteria bacterium]